MTKQNNSPTTNGESKHDILSMIDIGVPFLMLQKVVQFEYIVVGILQGERFFVWIQSKLTCCNSIRVEIVTSLDF